ncbi:MAG: hypothetical protein GX589_03885 [Deltaproteobacteria bacterium]|nr:hypothetical protein [Deltaproteobacteria bacterium]
MFKKCVAVAILIVLFSRGLLAEEQLRIVDQNGLIRAQASLQQVAQVRVVMSGGAGEMIRIRLVSQDNSAVVLEPHSHSAETFIFEAVPPGSWKIMMSGGSRQIKDVSILGR